MSFIRDVEKGHGFEAGYFLENDGLIDPKTRQISDSDAVTIGAEKYVLAGTVWPSNDSSAEGIVYEDVNVTSGPMAGSVVLFGRVYKDRLPVSIESDAQTALEKKGFVFFDTAPAVERPY